MRTKRNLRLENLEQRKVFTAVPGVEIDQFSYTIEDDLGPVEPSAIDVWEHAYARAQVETANGLTVSRCPGDFNVGSVSDAESTDQVMAELGLVDDSDVILFAGRSADRVADNDGFSDEDQVIAELGRKSFLYI